MHFRVIKKSTRSAARLGLIETSHGTISTPAMVPVATQASVKSLTSEQVESTGTQVLIANTFHLLLRPSDLVVKRQGGLHKFMHWERPLMTDSGGYQVFSLGFGFEQRTKKTSHRRVSRVLTVAAQPKNLQIGKNGVRFRSPHDGSLLFLGPGESIRTQERLGADIIFAFDECPPPLAGKPYVAASLERTHRWAEASLAAHRTKQALFGIVQGGRYQELRRRSALFIGSLPFNGFGIGGEFGTSMSAMVRMVNGVNTILPEAKPRHLLGIGHPEDIRRIVAAGVDTFDCVVPTQFARHGTAFTPNGRLDLSRSVWLRDRRPIDPRCSCATCLGYSRGYVAHLFRAKEITAMALTTIHNLTFFNRLVADVREDIRRGRL